MLIDYKKSRGPIVWLIFFSLFIGYLYFLPNILVPKFLNAGYNNGFNFWNSSLTNFEEMFSYGVSVRDVMDGVMGGGDPYLFEYKNLPTTWDYYYLSLLIGEIGSVLNISNPETIFVFLDFLLPPVAFILIFFLFYRFTKNRYYSIFSSIVFLFFTNIFVLKNLFYPSFYKGFSVSVLVGLVEGAFNESYSRLFVPSLSMIFFAFFLLSFYGISTDKKISTWKLFLASMSYGFLFYVYFYYWVFATVSLGFLMLFYIFLNRQYLKRMAKVFVGGLIISAPFWFRYFSLAKMSIYDELTQRVGLFKERIFIMPSLNYFFVLFIFFLVYFWYIKKTDEKIVGWHYLLSLMLSIPVVKNLQLIFGFNPQPDHWGSRVGVYIVVLVILIIVWLIFYGRSNKRATLLNFLCVIFSFFLVFIGLMNQIKLSTDAINNEERFLFNRGVLEAYDWINKNIPSGSVFMTDAIITSISLPFYTHVNLYTPHACLSLASNNEIYIRYAETYKIFMVQAEIIRDSLGKDFWQNSKYNLMQKQNINNQHSIYCGTHYPVLRSGSIKSELPEYVIGEFMEKYFSAPSNFRDIKYRADYVFVGPYEKSLSDFSGLKNKDLRMVYSNLGVEIFQVLK